MGDAGLSDRIVRIEADHVELLQRAVAPVVIIALHPDQVRPSALNLVLRRFVLPAPLGVDGGDTEARVVQLLRADIDGGQIYRGTAEACLAIVAAYHPDSPAIVAPALELLHLHLAALGPGRLSRLSRDGRAVDLLLSVLTAHPVWAMRALAATWAWLGPLPSPPVERVTALAVGAVAADRTHAHVPIQQAAVDVLTTVWAWFSELVFDLADPVALQPAADGAAGLAARLLGGPNPGVQAGALLLAAQLLPLFPATTLRHLAGAPILHILEPLLRRRRNIPDTVLAQHMYAATALARARAISSSSQRGDLVLATARRFDGCGPESQRAAIGLLHALCTGRGSLPYLRLTLRTGLPEGLLACLRDPDFAGPLPLSRALPIALEPFRPDLLPALLAELAEKLPLFRRALRAMAGAREQFRLAQGHMQEASLVRVGYMDYGPLEPAALARARRRMGTGLAFQFDRLVRTLVVPARGEPRADGWESDESESDWGMSTSDGDCGSGNNSPFDSDASTEIEYPP